MTLTLGTSSGNQSPQAIFVGTSSGNKAVNTAYIGTVSGNQVAYSALAATAAPSGEVKTTSGGGSYNTDDVYTATPSGGVGPFTYAWARVSGDTQVTINSDSTPSTRFQITYGIGESYSAIFACTVTDTETGLSTVSNSVSITFLDVV